MDQVQDEPLIIDKVLEAWRADRFKIRSVSMTERRENLITDYFRKKKLTQPHYTTDVSEALKIHLARVGVTSFAERHRIEQILRSMKERNLPDLGQRFADFTQAHVDNVAVGDWITHPLNLHLAPVVNVPLQIVNPEPIHELLEALEEQEEIVLNDIEMAQNPEDLHEAVELQQAIAEEILEIQAILVMPYVQQIQAFNIYMSEVYKFYNNLDGHYKKS